MERLVFCVGLVLFMQAHGKVLNKEEIKKITLDCLHETNYNASALASAIKSEKLPDYDRDYIEYMICSYRKQGYINDKDEILFDKMGSFLLNYYEKKDVGKILDVCKNVQHENYGEKLYFTTKCIIDNLHELEKQQAKN